MIIQPTAKEAKLSTWILSAQFGLACQLILLNSSQAVSIISSHVRREEDIVVWNVFLIDRKEANQVVLVSSTIDLLFLLLVFAA